MIQNLEIFLYKFITGPTNDSREHWFMSETNMIKFGEDRDFCTYYLTFDRTSEMCQLKDAFEHVIDTIKFADLLSYLHKKNLLPGWKPLHGINYSPNDLAKVGYTGKLNL